MPHDVGMVEGTCSCGQIGVLRAKLTPHHCTRQAVSMLLFARVSTL